VIERNNTGPSRFQSVQKRQQSGKILSSFWHRIRTQTTERGNEKSGQIQTQLPENEGKAEREGIEPTKPGLAGFNGFEDRGGHQAPITLHY